MTRFAIGVRLSAGLLLLLIVATGCQSWHSPLPGLTATKGDRLAVKQAKNDPFPSPSDVGMTAVE